MFNFIKSLDLKNYRHITALLKHNKDLNIFCQQYIKKYPFLEKPIYVLYFIQNNKYIPLCKCCKQPISYKKYLNHHAEYCSLKCSKLSKLCIANLINKFNKLNSLFKPYIEPLFTVQEYKGRQYTYKWKCKICNHEFESDINKATKFMENITGNVRLKRLPRCPYCYKKYQNFSKEETKLLNFCKQYFNEIQIHVRDIINPYELDIYIPSIRLAIEFNGVHWHSTQFKEHNYHLYKMELCNKQNIRLIQIWEDEWINYSNEICNKLKDIFLNNENFNNDILILDKCWYNNLQLSQYKLMNTLLPNTVYRLNKMCENCGYDIYKRYYKGRK